MGGVYAGMVPKASQFNITTAKYYSTDVTTTIASGSDTLLKWGTTFASSPDVTASGTGNATFTLNKSGIWAIEFQQRISYGTTPTTGDIYVYAFLQINGTIGPQFAGKTIPAPIPLTALPGSFTVRAFNAGDKIETRARNLCNQTATLSNNTGEMSHLSFTWIQGL